MLVYIALIVGCLLLYKGGDWLLEGVIDFGNHMEWPKAITGLLLVSLGTSAPELFVSLGAALQNQGAMSAGNVIGSNNINMAIVLGIAASVAVLKVDRLLRHQIVTLLVISAMATIAIVDGHVSRLEGLLLLVALCASFAYALKHNAANTAIIESALQVKPERSIRMSSLLTVGGLITLLVGAEAMIWGGIELAEQWNIPTSIVALTVTALGTSLPEIAATVVAVAKRETDLAVGNVIGSNLMNLGLVLGFSALVTPLKNIDIDTVSTGLFIGLTLFVFVMGFKFHRFTRWSGALLIFSYVAYVITIIV